jgi:protein-disulfide isomerase
MRVKTVMFLLLCFCLSPSGYAQAQSEAKDQPQGDVSALRTDVRALQAEQQQIITRLDELKQLLQANGHPANSAVLPSPQPPSTLDIHGENFRGDSGARVAIVEYADFECPYCGQYARDVYPQISDKYIKTGKVKYFYRDLPLPMHPHAMSAARAGRCAGEQGKYWEIHDNLFANQTALGLKDISDRAQGLGIDVQKLSDCLSSDKYTGEIRKSVSEAQKLGIDGTPTFFLGVIGENGDVVKIEKAIKGTSPFLVFKTSLDALLAMNGQEAVSTH